jgi:regulator of protease activity HflC (stomatin/prohibitin superfamily)
VILRLGHFHALKGPGLFFIIPVIDAIPYWIDTRVITTGFKAEKTLTKDTVPVDVDAVLFWKVVDPKKAAWMWPTIKAPSVGPPKPPCAT